MMQKVLAVFALIIVESDATSMTVKLYSDSACTTLSWNGTATFTIEPTLSGGACYQVEGQTTWEKVTYTCNAPLMTTALETCTDNACSTCTAGNTIVFSAGWYSADCQSIVVTPAGQTTTSTLYQKIPDAPATVCPAVPAPTPSTNTGGSATNTGGSGNGTSSNGTSSNATTTAAPKVSTSKAGLPYNLIGASMLLLAAGMKVLA